MNKKRRNTKRVMMISSVHVWLDTRIFFKEAMSLANDGFKVDFYAIADGENKSLGLLKTDNLKLNYLKRRSRLTRWIYWIKFYRQFINSSDYFLHIQDPELLYVARAIKRKLKNQVFITYDMHEHLPAAVLTKPWIPQFMRSWLSKRVAHTEKKLMRYCDKVIFAELSYKNNYKDLNLDSIDVLNYPKYEPEEFTVSQSKSDQPFTLVYVGALIRQRGLYEMLDLMAEIINVHHLDVQLNLVGPINENKDVVKEYVEKSNLQNAVHFLGRMPYSKIWDIYRNSDVGLCLLQPTPNNINSLSTKILEYMAAGLPFIASDFPAFHEICVEDDCGVDYNPKDVDLMVDQVKYLMKNEKRRKQMGQNGIEAFKNKYNWKIEEKKLIQSYENKVNNND
ncbi:glycosyl transferase [Companilactobacillus sp. RD055328]|uniref:glycosyltransferase family 4 protein n=1 Tax=Companilactobacillus sp. RD055328 TaxID=2916634 RepID=UPI001FC7DDDC|nr:glycosyltransferase family 4 protein [Companilactobacillus sp. RD055328]GKQ43359.1 glycosyl transferase [Companilactobacillus sp. RD055328]